MPNAISPIAVLLPAFVGVLAATAGFPDFLAGNGPPGIRADSERARFAPCSPFAGSSGDCVIDGDTFRYRGEKIRIADIDTPETHPPRCPAEAALGARATQRITALLNAGPFTLEGVERSHDRYGRRLAVVTRGGQSLGQALVDEGLARPWDGARRPWC